MATKDYTLQEGFRWVVPPHIFVKNYARWARDIEGKIFALFTMRGRQMEAHMRTNAPWTDRTGEARDSLTVDVFRSGFNSIQMDLHYKGLSHGYWLEVAYNGKYGIILPTIQEFTPILKRDLRSL